MKILKIAPFVLALAACANAGVVQVAPDTYLLSKQDNAGMFGNLARLKTEVIQEANDFAASKGKVAVAVSMDETPMGPGRFGSFQYQFRLVDANDPSAARVTLTKRPDVVIESNSRTTGEVNVKTPGQAPDLYAELLKLDDLKKRGILTEAEFAAQKKRLLEQSQR